MIDVESKLEELETRIFQLEQKQAIEILAGWGGFTIEEYLDKFPEVRQYYKEYAFKEKR